MTQSQKLEIFAGILLYTLSPVGMTIIPLILGAATRDLGLSESEIGLLATLDLAGLAIASVAAVSVASKITLRRIALLGISAIVLGNLASLSASSFATLATSRFIAESGSGLVYVVALLVLGRSNNPNRYFAIGLAGTVTIAALIFMAAPQFPAEAGALPVYFTHIALALVFGLSIAAIRDNKHSTNYSSSEVRGSPVLLTLIFLGIASFFVAEGALWGYIEYIGSQLGMSQVSIGSALALSQVASLLGAMAAAIIGERFGTSWPLILAFSLFALSLGTVSTTGHLGYVIAVSMSQFLYIFSVPYMLAMAVRYDPTDRYFAYSIAFQLGGFALGPMLIASLIGDFGMFTVPVVGIGATLLTVLILIPLSVRRTKQ